MEIEKKYILDEITIKVNKRELLYDYRMNRVIYANNEITKEEYRLPYKKWSKVCRRYNLKTIISKYEEI